MRTKEGGRGNVSFPVVEKLKPQGFKERSDVRFPSSPTSKKHLLGVFIFYNIKI